MAVLAAKSDQFDIAAGTDATIKRLVPNEYHGRVRLAYFNWTGEAGDANSVVSLCKLPKGARILQGFLSFGNHAATSTLDIGLYGADGSGYIDADNSVADDVDALMDGVDVSTGADGTATFANTEVLNYGYVTQKELDVKAKFLTAGPAAGEHLRGHILYVVD